jgi:hypothetical protein
MPRLRRGSTIDQISANTMNRLMELQKESLESKPSKSSTKLPFTKVVGRNDCGYDLKPGSPVRLADYFPEESAYSGSARGWFRLLPLTLPTTSTAVWTTPGIVLDGCVNGDLVDVAIDGLVEASVGGGGAGSYVCPNLSTTLDHRERLQSSSVGFAITRAVLSTTHLIQFGPNRWEAFYMITQRSPLRATLYHGPGSTLATDVHLIDAHSLAAWQVVNDVGWAEMIFGQWIIKTPVCRDV